MENLEEVKQKMINSNICFRIETDWNPTIMEPLKTVCLSYQWDLPKRKCVWIFPVAIYQYVTSVVGKTIKFNKEDVEVVNQKFHAEGIQGEKWKGKGSFQLFEFPKIYQIIEFKKNNEGKPQEIKTDVDKENVKVAFEVLSEYPLGKYVKSRTIAEHICEKLKVTRFNRETGSFDWAKFFGNRNDYFRYFYYPIKILDYKGVVAYHKRGMVKRMVDKFEVQTKFNEVIQ